MSPFIEIPLGDAKVPELLAEGTYDLRIEAVDPVESKKTPGRTDIRVRMSAMGEANSEAIFEHIIGLHSSDDSDTRNMKLRKIVGFMEAFGIPYGPNGFNLEDMPGAEGRVRVKQDEYEGRLSNKIVYSW